MIQDNIECKYHPKLTHNVHHNFHYYNLNKKEEEDHKVLFQHQKVY